MPKNKKKNRKKEFLVLILITLLVTTLSLANLIISSQNTSANTEEIVVETMDNNSIVEYWNSFLKKNPNYLPGWLELAKLEMENKNIEKAFIATNKALEINPNSEEVKEVIKSLNL